MIVDEIANLEKYADIHPAFRRVADFLKGHDVSAFADGRYLLCSDGTEFVNVQTIPVKGKEEARLESHRKMIDIQVPLTGDETMGYTPLTCAEPSEYDGQKDISFHPGGADSYIHVRKGMFVIFFPQDVHAPGIASEMMKKAVFKIPVQEKQTM